MQVFRTKDSDYYDYSNDTYFFVNECGYFKFYQMGSFDLAFSVHKFDTSQNVLSFSIEKDEYPMVYELISKMLDEVERLKFIRGTDRISQEYCMLYKKGYFSWKSDAPVNENNYGNNEFIYNSFNIHKNETSYIFEFDSKLEAPFFTVEVNTDRSRYGVLRFPIWDFFNQLENACEIVETEDKISEIISFYHNQRIKK